MAKKLIELPSSKQFERVYKSDDCTTIWKYDLDKFTNGPISVEFKWSAEYLKENRGGGKEKKEGKLGELHDAFAKIDAKRKKKKVKKAEVKPAIKFDDNKDSTFW